MGVQPRLVSHEQPSAYPPTGVTGVTCVTGHTGLTSNAGFTRFTSERGLTSERATPCAQVINRRMSSRDTGALNRRPGKGWGTTINDTHHGMGPGLALIDAILSGEVESVYFLRQNIGNQALAESCAEVIRRALELRSEFDEELVMDLAHVHLSTWRAYDDIVIRKRDRWRFLSAAIRIARSRSLRGLRHYGMHATTDSDVALPPLYRPNALFIGGGVQHTFGIAYASTLTLIHLAASSGRDPDDVVGEYRAITARQQIRPPEVQPSA